VQIGDREIALFNLGDRFLAVDGRCPHQGGPLADGIVAGNTVVCPLHAWKVNLENGCVERPGNQGRCVATYPTKVEEGIVMITSALPRP
jgi:nitrite reductase (NADH) small subunit